MVARFVTCSGFVRTSMIAGLPLALAAGLATAAGGLVRRRLAGFPAFFTRASCKPEFLEFQNTIA